MSELTFTDEDAPATVRKTEPNPFLAAVASMEADSGKGKGFDTETTDKNLAKVRRQLTSAGEAAGVTVRWTTSLNDNGKTHVTFYAVSKISRKATGPACEWVEPSLPVEPTVESTVEVEKPKPTRRAAK